MITKPEDAVPHTITVRLDRDPIGPEEFTQYVDRVVVILNNERELNGPHRFFAASECAEIARAYASALHASEFNSADAAIDAAKWESKFKEWETK